MKYAPLYDFMELSHSVDKYISSLIDSQVQVEYLTAPYTNEIVGIQGYIDNKTFYFKTADMTKSGGISPFHYDDSDFTDVHIELCNQMCFINIKDTLLIPVPTYMIMACNPNLDLNRSTESTNTINTMRR